VEGCCPCWGGGEHLVGVLEGLRAWVVLQPWMAVVTACMGVHCCPYQWQRSGGVRSEAEASSCSQCSAREGQQLYEHLPSSHHCSSDLCPPEAEVLLSSCLAQSH
jgi:hypothetical protein